MAVKARATVTLASIRDVASVTRYYILQSSTAAAPSKPTASPPGGSWTKTEPSYSTGSTKSLYFTDLTVFTDGDYFYSDVSLSSSYEAAKAAYNQAVNAASAAQAAQETADAIPATIPGKNLSPFFSHDLDDIYNDSSNPEGYWIKNGSNGWRAMPKFSFTQLEDGWLHVHIDNSDGTAVIRNDCCTPKYDPVIKPGSKYTFLVEFRNNASTGTGAGSDFYIVQQAGYVQFWGQDVPNAPAEKLEGIGWATTQIANLPIDGSYAFSRFTKYSEPEGSEHLGQENIMSTFVFRANAGAVLDYDVRLSLYEGEYWGPYSPYAISDVSSIRQNADTALSQSVEYIVGTQTATTASWTGKTTDAVLKAGKTIAYRLPQTSAANATLNLTLSGGGTTGEKAVYYNNSRVGTHYPANSVIHMTYDGSSWRITNYNADTQNRVRLQNVINASGTITAGRIICGTASGYKNIAAGAAFDLTYPLLYALTAIAAGATTGTRDNNFLQINSVPANNNGTVQSGAAGKTLYLKGKVSGNTFTIAASPFMTTAVPSSEDGFVYIPLGLMYSATQIYFSSSDKLYAFKGGQFRELARGEAAEAARTATNYLYDSVAEGLVVSQEAVKTDSELEALRSPNVRVTAEGVDIYTDGTTRVAHYGAEAVIGADDEAHTTIGQGRMVFDDDAQNLMFMGRTNNDTTGKALCQLSLPLDHKTVVGSTWEFTEAWDLSFPEKTVSEIIGVGFVAEGLEELTSAQWSATIEGGLLTKITITELGVNRITEYLENYAEVNSLVVKFLTADSVQTYVLDNANNDYITPVSPTMQTDVPGDGAFSVGGGLASGDDSAAMAGGVASGRRSFAFGYSSETGPARSSKEGEVRFKSEKMAVEGEFMTFGSEGEISGVSFNSTYVNTSSSYINVYELGDYVRLDGAIVTKANVPAGSVLASNLPKSFFGGGDQGKPRMRIFGKLVLPASQTGVITGTHGTLQAILIANQWVDAGSVTIPSAGVWLVRFNFNMTDSVATGHITGQINYGESGTTGVRNRQSVYFNKSTKDLCITVVALITTTGSASVPCRLYSTFASSSPGNAYVNVSAVRLSGGDLSDVAELNIMNDEDLEEMTTTPTYKASLLTRGTTAIPSGSTIRFGATYIRDSLWDGGYNG